MKPKICLVMIVKNEAHVLECALRSVIKYIDYLYICDTGSNGVQRDDMQEIIESVVRDALVAGIAIDWRYDSEPWQDFAYNRNVALRSAEGVFPDADWLFTLDADDYVTQWQWFMPPPDAVGFYVNVKSGNIAYPRVQMFKAGEGWHYRGVVHEYPTIDGQERDKLGTMPITVQSTREGARNKDPQKYMIDADLLHNALCDPRTDDDLRPRYEFYLAQSYENAGDKARACNWYKHRFANTEGYQEERYVSLVRLARLLNADAAALEQFVKHAQAICPQRREAVCEGMEGLNRAGNHELAYVLWLLYHEAPSEPVGLFIEPEVYRWRLWEQAGIAAYYVGEIKESINYFHHALKAQTNLPIDTARLISNLAFAVQKL